MVYNYYSEDNCNWSSSAWNCNANTSSTINTMLIDDVYMFADFINSNSWMLYKYIQFDITENKSPKNIDSKSITRVTSISMYSTYALVESPQSGDQVNWSYNGTVYLYEFSNNAWTLNQNNQWK